MLLRSHSPKAFKKSQDLKTYRQKWQTPRHTWRNMQGTQYQHANTHIPGSLFPLTCYRWTVAIHWGPAWELKAEHPVQQSGETLRPIRTSAPGERSVRLLTPLTKGMALSLAPPQFWTMREHRAIGVSLVQPQPNSPRDSSILPSSNPFPYPGLIILGIRVYPREQGRLCIIAINTLYGDLYPEPMDDGFS